MYTAYSEPQVSDFSKPQRAGGIRLRWLAALVALVAGGLGVYYVVALLVFLPFKLLGIDTSGNGYYAGLIIIFGVLAVIASILYRRLLPHAIGGNPALPITAPRVAALAVTGVAEYLCIVLLMAILSSILDISSDSSGSSATATGLSGQLLSVVAYCVSAPVNEEIIFRGIAMQLALRAVRPAGDARFARGEGAEPPISGRQFWTANVLQAAAFGIFHLNLTQGIAAFIGGLLLGWVAWRCGSLAWSMLLHGCYNFGSFLAKPILAAVGVLPLFVLAPAIFALGLRAFKRLTTPRAS